MKKKERDSTKSDKDAFLKVLSSKAGNISAACKAVGIGRETYYCWIKSDPDFKLAADGVMEELKDFAESKLQESIKSGAAWAICFFLKCRAKDRGYVERSEITGKDGGPIDAAPTMFNIVFESPASPVKKET